MSTTEADIKEIMRKLTKEVVTEGNLDLVDEYFADDYVGHHSGAPGPYGPDGLKEFVSAWRTAFPDLEYTVENIIAEGDTLARRNRFTGTHEGEFLGIEPTGEEVQGQDIAIVRFEDGKIVESWTQADMMGLMQQLGVVEPPGA